MQTCLEKKGIEARGEALVRNDYAENIEYSALHSDAIGNGDPLGKGTGIGGHTHSTPENKDEKTLNILLLHWVNHNKSHEESFKEWVDKARNMRKEETANSIEKAIEYMQKANEMLKEAKEYM